MAAIDSEPPRIDRMQLAAHLCDPVAIVELADREIGGAVDRRQQGQTCQIRGLVEVSADFPPARSVLDFEDTDTRGRGVQQLHRVAKRLGRRMAFECCQGSIGCHVGAPRAARTPYRMVRRCGKAPQVPPRGCT